MKFTSEDLMKAMGLQVGDRIKVNNKIYTIAKSTECEGAWVGYEDDENWHNLQYLVNGYDYEILPKPKRVGDLKCVEIECKKCPLRCPLRNICDGVDVQNNLYGELEIFKQNCINDGIFDQEIYDLLKARLDKEVNE